MIADNLTEKVLDHGYVVLIDAMPAEPASGDQRIVDAARVSMAHLPEYVYSALGMTKEPTPERTREQDIKLIEYMFTNAHGTPFEKVRFEFLVHAPIFVARQWFRYRASAFNEVSARYSKLPCEFYVPELSRMQAQHTSNKQASGEALEASVATLQRTQLETFSKLAYSQYESFLGEGLARELARMVLPTNFYTTWYWTVDLRNLFNFLKERMDEHAQFEIRQYAKALFSMATYIAPIAMRIFDKHVTKTRVFDV